MSEESNENNMFCRFKGVPSELLISGKYNGEDVNSIHVKSLSETIKKHKPKLTILDEMPTGYQKERAYLQAIRQNMKKGEKALVISKKMIEQMYTREYELTSISKLDDKLAEGIYFISINKLVINYNNNHFDDFIKQFDHILIQFMNSGLYSKSFLVYNKIFQTEANIYIVSPSFSLHPNRPESIKPFYTLLKNRRNI